MASASPVAADAPEVNANEGLSSLEAGRRLLATGPNELLQRRGTPWPRALARQLTHPLALLLWAAAALALVSGGTVVAIAVFIVIALNAALAFAQEQQAGKAVEALSRYLPQHAMVVRDGQRRQVEARVLVPGDVIVVSEGDGISADARLLAGSLEVDTSALTGESLPVYRTADGPPASGSRLRGCESHLQRHGLHGRGRDGRRPRPRGCRRRSGGSQNFRSAPSTSRVPSSSRCAKSPGSSPSWRSRSVPRSFRSACLQASHQPGRSRSRSVSCSATSPKGCCP